jgi:hypothetical protein
MEHGQRQKPVCPLALQRFYDSDKDVLAVIAVGSGALVKLIQEYLEYNVS